MAERSGEIETPTLRGDRPPCAVPWCEVEVVVWSGQTVEIDGRYVDALVPFCREHGPEVGSDV